MKVQTKLIIGFLSIYLLFGLVIFISIYESSKSLEKTATYALSSFTQKLMEQIDKDINERIGDFKIYSKDLELQEFLKQSNVEFEKLSDMQSYITQKDNEWSSTQKNELTPFMQELIDNKISKQLRQRTKFYESDYGYKLYGEVFITNKYGANAAETGKTSDYRQDDEEWWQRGKADGVYVEDVKYDQSADVYSTAISIRVDDNNENFIGVIKIVLNIEGMIKLIREADAEKKYSSTEFTLVDGKGRIIFSTKKYEIFNQYEMYSEVKDKRGYFAYKDKQTGTERLLFNAHSQGYKSFKGLGWISIADADRSDILKPINDLILNILIFAIVLIILAGLIGFYIYSSVSSSLRKFENTINEISKGNMEARVDIKSKDEFYTLSLAFNSMADQLKSLKKVEKNQKLQKELEALEASYKTGFISEETYKKERKRLEEDLIKAKVIDAKLLQEKGFIKKEE